ncbi:MAG: hypothetical protein IJ358_02885 [Clostridia bacterium]|nr:hypothetical protein [Clostridia bacterium]
MEQNINYYSYDDRAKIYEDARKSLLQCKPFKVNDKLCESLVEVMEEDVTYLLSCLKDVKEVVREGEEGKQHKEIKVGNTTENRQLAKTINAVNKRILDAKKLNRELGKKMALLGNRNKTLQAQLKHQTELYGCGDDLLNKVENIFKEMTNLFNLFIDNDTISIALVVYRHQWRQQYEKYLKKYSKDN